MAPYCFITGGGYVFGSVAGVDLGAIGLDSGETIAVVFLLEFGAIGPVQSDDKLLPLIVKDVV